MFFNYLCLYCVCISYFVHADVSHLKSSAFKSFSVFDGNNNFNGYNYDPPIITTSQQPSLPFPTPPTVLLPEIIINKRIKENERPWNVYLPPKPIPSALPTPDAPAIIPPLADDSDANSYLPPFHDNDEPVLFPSPPPTIPIEPASTYLPPTNYLPPVIVNVPPSDTTDDQNGYNYVKPTKSLPQSRILKDLDFFRSQKPNALQLELNDLRCLQNRGGYFRANLIVQSFIDNVPILDIDSQDPRCQLHLVRTKFILNIHAIDFERCGVYACNDKELCVKLRFPQVFGMKSVGDALLTLQCKLQERIAIKTHALRFGVTDFNQGRSAGTFAVGGSQQLFRTQLGLYRQSNGAFTKSLDPGATVQLGEELMLRAHVKAGDGWNHTRVTDVSLQRLAQTGEILNSATLITSNGCVNPTMRSICPYPPVFEPPLGHRFGFRAVMFQGMKSGDEMIMNVKIVGCIDQNDCSDRHNCNDNTPLSGRFKRHLNGTISSDRDERVEISKISFRVEMPENNFNAHSEHKNIVGGIAVAATISFVCLLMIIGLIVVNRKVFRKYCVWEKY